MVSLKTAFYKKELSVEDLSYISKLLDTNISFHQTLDLLRNKKNEKIFEDIIKQLDEGKLIETIIPSYLPKQIKDYMFPLLKTLSFSSALSLSLEFYDKHKNNESNLLSQIAYPCILLFITITVLYLFDLYGMDTIFNLVTTFTSDIGIYKDIRVVFRIIINFFYYGLLLGILLLIFFIQPKRISILYMFISKYLPNSLVTTYYSEEYVSLMLSCVKKGYKTKEILEILKSMKTKPIISFLAYHMDESLLQGETLRQATKKNYYDLSLPRFIKIANYTNDFGNMLEAYIMLAKEKISRMMKKYTLTIQICTYMFIGIIVIFIYQILFMPMQALSIY